MKETGDEKLISRYLKGDEQSLEILIARYIKPVYGFVYRYTGGAPEAEDITQETFVKAWKNLKKFDPRRNRFANLRGRPNQRFKTWLFSIAKNAAIDHLRKKRAIPFSAFENEEGENIIAETFADPAPLPSEIVERAEATGVVAVAIERLPSKYRTVLHLRHNDQFNFREISESLGEPLNTIKSRYRRAVIMLKGLFGKTGHS